MSPRLTEQDGVVRDCSGVSLGGSDRTGDDPHVDPELFGLLNQAQDDPEAVALVLFGSAASGPTHRV